MIPFPPPRVLWPKMLKACSRADLDLLRCEGLIQIAAEGFRVGVDPNEERVEFMGKVKLEMKRRARQESRLGAGVLQPKVQTRRDAAGRHRAGHRPAVRQEQPVQV